MNHTRDSEVNRDAVSGRPPGRWGPGPADEPMAAGQPGSCRRGRPPGAAPSGRRPKPRAGRGPLGSGGEGRGGGPSPGAGIGQRGEPDQASRSGAPPRSGDRLPLGLPSRARNRRPRSLSSPRRVTRRAENPETAVAGPALRGAGLVATGREPPGVRGREAGETRLGAGLPARPLRTGDRAERSPRRSDHLGRRSLHPRGGAEPAAGSTSAFPLRRLGLLSPHLPRPSRARRYRASADRPKGHRVPRGTDGEGTEGSASAPSRTCPAR